MALNKLLWVGRLTGPKGEIARRLAYEVFPKLSDTQCLLIGGPEIPRDWPQPASNIRFVGQVADVTPYYREADLVIGAGRVALEAMRLGVPVLAVGECCYVGLVDAARIARAKATNFGDCYAPAHIDWPALERDLQALQTQSFSDVRVAYPDFLAEYDAEQVETQVRQVYRQACAEAVLRRFREVPILMYHRVTRGEVAGSRHKIYVTVEQLRAQLKSLKRRGFESVTFADLVAGKRVRRPVMLTFDDGYQDNYENLLPLLEEFDYRAVIYALADPALGQNLWDIPGGEPAAPLMSEAQLLACHRSGRIEIGSHGLSHAHLPQLTEQALQRELVDSKTYLESLLGTEVLSFAYPYGDCSSRECRAVADAGYLFGVATVSGPLHPAEDFYRIRRINLMPKDQGARFWKKTSGFYLRYCRWKGKDFPA